MTDLVDERIAQGAERDGELLLYDYFKHMTTLCLVTLGGIMSISQTSGLKVPVRDLTPSLALVTVAGAASLYGMELILKGRLQGKGLPKTINIHRFVASGSFGIGVGAFLGVFGNFIR
jgi:hypothetical protein